MGKTSKVEVLLTKEIFCETLNKVEEYVKRINKADEVLLTNLFESIFVNILDIGLKPLEEFEKQLIGYNKNLGTIISWWCWEVDFGARADDYPVQCEGGEELYIATSEDLWDLLMEIVGNE